MHLPYKFLFLCNFCFSGPGADPDFSMGKYLSVFYPTALKGCRGIVFTHGVQMGIWAGGPVT